MSICPLGLGLRIFAFAALLTAAVLPAPVVRAAPPADAYEPNGSAPAATGPLGFGQAYEANLHTAGDRDYYYFYVTSTRATEATLTLVNLGGGTQASDVDMTVYDLDSTPVAAAAFVREGESRTVGATLAPQKYFVEVAVNAGFGDTYRLTTGGGTGAFGQYSQIAGRCASGEREARSARRRLDRARSTLLRATARARRARYMSPRAQETARSSRRRARARVGREQKALRRATERADAWCPIAS